MPRHADTPVAATPGARPFFGHRVVRAAFTLAMFGWGIGFYGPPVYLHVAIERTGWSLSWVSSAVTVHYLFGALVVTQLPRLHARFGVGATALAGAMIATYAFAPAVFGALLQASAGGAAHIGHGAGASC